MEIKFIRRIVDGETFDFKTRFVIKQDVKTKLEVLDDEGREAVAAIMPEGRHSFLGQNEDRVFDDWFDGRNRFTKEELAIY